MTNSQMKSIGKIEAELLHRSIDEALKAVADRYGLQYIRTKTLRFDPDGMFFTVPVEGRVKTLGENGLTSQAAANSSTAAILLNKGLEINALAYIQGSIYRVTGYNSRKPKNAIELVNTATGRPAAGPVGMVKSGVLAYKARFQQRINEG